MTNLIFNVPPIHKANPAIARTAINTNKVDRINIALPNFHVVLLFLRVDILDKVDLGK